MKPHEDREETIQYRAAQRSEKLVKARLDQAIKTLLSNRDGREYIWWLLDITRQGQTPFNSENSHLTDFACGEQNVGYQILAHMLETNPEGYLALLKERKDDQDVLDAQSIRDANQAEFDYPDA